jgi:hypothetical protein
MGRLPHFWPNSQFPALGLTSAFSARRHRGARWPATIRARVRFHGLCRVGPVSQPSHRALRDLSTPHSAPCV